MKDTPYHSQVFQAVQSLMSNYKQPGQEAQDEKIVSSLLAVLSSQNVPSQATSIAGSIASMLEKADVPDKVDELVSFVVDELRRPSINTQIADVVKQLIGFVILMRAQAPEIFDDLPAVELLEAGYGRPDQQANDKKIVSSLLIALGRQNVPTLATGIAESLVSGFEEGEVAGGMEDLVSSIVAELKDPEVNTQITSIVKEMIELMIQVGARSTRIVYDIPVGPTTAITHTSISSAASTRTDTATSSPISKSELSSSPSSSTMSKESQLSSLEESFSEESSSEEESKTNAAQMMGPFFGYLSMGVVAGVIASFF
ncbi:hypothetical protein IWW37_003191 [Coemansia sp. RSA 2050]|nr:hypothetical protein IWW37_003191 [Coemansia sp. RSA 2050]